MIASLVAAACHGGARGRAPVDAAVDAGPVAVDAGPSRTTDGGGADAGDRRGGPVAPSAPDAGADAADFTELARQWFRIAACGDDGPVPAPLDPAIVAEHCAVLAREVEAYRARYLALARPYLRALRPADVPDVVVYPFGGGDLLSALVAFPDAREITAISLEYAGDPRRLPTLTSRARQRATFALFEETLRWPLRGNWKRSRQLQRTQRGALPGELGDALVALAVHGFEPTGLRYVALAPDGGLRYLSAADLAALDRRRGRMLDPAWVDPDCSPAFASLELRFRPRGGGPERVFRHLAANLDDRHLAREPALLAHLEAKGRVAAMTRAADYLLWGDDFARLRAYLTSHLVWMISDSTGVPPPFAAAAGLEQLTYGTFAGAFEPSDLEPRRRWNRAFRDLWRRNPPVPLPFRFGYPDVGGHAHLLITRRPAPP